MENTTQDDLHDDARRNITWYWRRRTSRKSVMERKQRGKSSRHQPSKYFRKASLALVRTYILRKTLDMEKGGAVTIVHSKQALELPRPLLHPPPLLFDFGSMEGNPSTLSSCQKTWPLAFQRYWISSSSCRLLRMRWPDYPGLDCFLPLTLQASWEQQTSFQ